MIAKDVEADIVRECDALKAMLLLKNAAYGNAALDPVRVFSRADPVEQIRVRIDDKLSRLSRGREVDDDVVLDLLGYLVLLRIATKDRTRQDDPRLRPSFGTPYDGDGKAHVITPEDS
jgi:hypothetical protein